MLGMIYVHAEEVPAMTTLLSDLALVVTKVFAWIGTIASTITSTPLLLLTTGFLVLGGAVGIFGRLLSKH